MTRKPTPFPSTLDSQREYIRQGKCGDHYPQSFRDYAADHLAKVAKDDTTLCTSLAFLFMRWNVARYAAASETLERLGVDPER